MRLKKRRKADLTLRSAFYVSRVVVTSGFIHFATFFRSPAPLSPLAPSWAVGELGAGDVRGPGQGTVPPPVCGPEPRVPVPSSALAHDHAQRGPGRAVPDRNVPGRWSDPSRAPRAGWARAASRSQDGSEPSQTRGLPPRRSSRSVKRAPRLDHRQELQLVVLRRLLGDDLAGLGAAAGGRGGSLGLRGFGPLPLRSRRPGRGRRGSATVARGGGGGYTSLHLSAVGFARLPGGLVAGTQLARHPLQERHLRRQLVHA